jgi:hypothetical protein
MVAECKGSVRSVFDTKSYKEKMIRKFLSLDPKTDGDLSLKRLYLSKAMVEY